jgi:hypothetical protein
MWMSFCPSTVPQELRRRTGQGLQLVNLRAVGKTVAVPPSDWCRGSRRAKTAKSASWDRNKSASLPASADSASRPPTIRPSAVCGPWSSCEKSSRALAPKKVWRITASCEVGLKPHDGKAKSLTSSSWTSSPKTPCKLRPLSIANPCQLALSRLTEPNARNHRDYQLNCCS